MINTSSFNLAKVGSKELRVKKENAISVLSGNSSAQGNSRLARVNSGNQQVYFRGNLPLNDEEKIKLQAIRARYIDKFHHNPQKVSVSPGRAELIGGHTDYNGGMIVSSAIPQKIYVAVGTRPSEMDKEVGSRVVRAYSENLNDMQEFDLAVRRDNNNPGTTAGDWLNYVEGTVRIEEEKLKEKDNNFRMPGSDLYIVSEIGEASGVSSSAALECATGGAALAVAGKELGKDLSREELAELAQRAEIKYAKANCGRMDQQTSAQAEGGGLLIDSRTQKVKPFPLEVPGHTLLIADSRVKHKLAGASTYNQRRKECAIDLIALKQIPEFQNIRNLCDISAEQFNVNKGKIEQAFSPDSIKKLELEHKGEIEGIIDEFSPNEESRKMPIDKAKLMARCEHAIMESDRAQQAAEALNQANVQRFAGLMNESHASLRDKYEVSCPELNTLVDIAREAGATGARMMGGGNGGPVIAVVPNEKVEQVKTAIAEKYTATGKDAKGNKAIVLEVKPSIGTQIIDYRSIDN